MDIIEEQNDAELIEAYCKEIMPDFPPMTVAELIESHRSLRESNRINHKQWLKDVSEAVDMRLQMTIDDRYVLWSDLEKMTLTEIVARL